MPPASAAWQVMYCGIAPGAAETPVARVRHRRVGRIRPRRLAWDVQGQSAMRCLITGGAGFIGSHLVEYLVGAGRSEEHTSELQSRLHLVCRLLLEKKKKKKRSTY